MKVVREATWRYRDVNQAEADGYQLLFGCVSGPDDGAMGLHYVNMALVGDGALDPRKPEIVIYEPLPNGGRRLIGADYLVFADAWHANNAGTPQLGGPAHAPDRKSEPLSDCRRSTRCTSGRGKPNPSGAFVNWHSDVSCEQFNAEG